MQGRTEELKRRGGARFENAVTSATRPVGPSLRRDGGRAHPFPWVRKF